jgi:hypothetical protein
MLEQIPDPPPSIWKHQCHNVAELETGKYAHLAQGGYTDMSQMQWWVAVCPRARYFVDFKYERAIMDGVSVMSLLVSEEDSNGTAPLRVDPLLPLSHEDTEVLLIYLSQGGIKIPWHTLYSS